MNMLCYEILRKNNRDNYILVKGEYWLLWLGEEYSLGQPGRSINNKNIQNTE